MITHPYQLLDSLESELLENVEIDESSDEFICIHPFVTPITFSPTPDVVRKLNSAYEIKSEALRKAELKTDWHSYIFIHERPYRLEALLTIASEIEKDLEYWNLFLKVWADTESIYTQYDEWKFAMCLRKKPSQKTIAKKDFDNFLKLPDCFDIYRGTSLVDDGSHSLSWTIDQKVALWYSTRFSEDGVVLNRIVNKNDVFVYFNGRNEGEIILMPSCEN